MLCQNAIIDSTAGKLSRKQAHWNHAFIGKLILSPLVLDIKGALDTNNNKSS